MDNSKPRQLVHGPAEPLTKLTRIREAKPLLPAGVPAHNRSNIEELYGEAARFFMQGLRVYAKHSKNPTFADFLKKLPSYEGNDNAIPNMLGMDKKRYQALGAATPEKLKLIVPSIITHLERYRVMLFEDPDLIYALAFGDLTVGRRPSDIVREAYLKMRDKIRWQQPETDSIARRVTLDLFKRMGIEPEVFDPDLPGYLESSGPLGADWTDKALTVARKFHVGSSLVSLGHMALTLSGLPRISTEELDSAVAENLITSGMAIRIGRCQTLETREHLARRLRMPLEKLRALEWDEPVERGTEAITHISKAVNVKYITIKSAAEQSVETEQEEEGEIGDSPCTKHAARASGVGKPDCPGDKAK